MRLCRVRVTPRDDEHLLLLAEQPFDQAPPGRDIEDVVLVDRRRHEQQRHLVDLFSGGPVLDQLEHLVVEHDRTRCRGQVPADLELAHVHAGRQVRRSRHIPQEPPPAPDEVRPALVDALLEDGGVRPRKVRGGQRVEHVGRREPCLALGAPVEIRVGDQLIDGLAGREVALHHAAEHPIVLPAAVAESAITLRRGEHRTARYYAGKLGAESPRIAHGRTRMTRQSGDRSPGCSRLQEPAHPAVFDRGVGEHHVEASACGQAETGPRFAASLLRC